MTTKHTPGPWEVQPDQRSQGEALAIVGGSSLIIARTPKATLDMHRRVDEANARLIAAAPELLEALRAINQVLGGSQPIDIPGALMIARAAIAKAEGRI